MLPKRYTLAFFAFFGIFLVNIVRIEISYIVPAFNLEATNTATNSTSNNSKSDISFTNNSSTAITESEQGFALGSYFYGYIISQVPLAILGKQYGNHLVFGIITGLTGVLNILLSFSPSLRFLGYGRILVGLLQGGSYPLLHGIWPEFAPVSQVATLISIEYAGGGFGAFLATPVCALIGDWSRTLMLTGVVGLVFTVFWFILFMNLRRENGSRVFEKNENGNENPEKPIPWLRIITNPAFLSLVAAQISSNFGSYTVQLLSVKYIVDYLSLDLKSAGFLGALPSLAKPISCLLIGPFSDYLIAKNPSHKTPAQHRLTIRKLLSWVLFLGTSLSFFMMLPIKNNLKGIILLWSIVMALDGFGPAAFKANHIEIAPSFSGITFSIANMFGNLPGIVAPGLCGFLLERFSDDKGFAWSLVFVETGVFCVFGAFIFQCFSSVEKQEFEDQGDRVDEEEVQEFRTQV